MKKMIFSLMATGMVLAMAPTDAAAYVQWGTADMAYGGAGSIGLNCKGSLGMCFTDNNPFQSEFVSGGTYTVYEGTPGGVRCILYSEEVDMDGSSSYIGELVDGDDASTNNN